MMSIREMRLSGKQKNFRMAVLFAMKSTAILLYNAA